MFLVEGLPFQQMGVPLFYRVFHMKPAVLQSLMRKLALSQMGAPADATRAGGVNRMPVRPQAQLMSRTDLPAADFGGTIRPDEITLAAMPDKPFKFAMGADEFASMAGSPQLGTRLREIVGGTGDALGQMSRSGLQRFRDGVANEETIQALRAILAKPSPSRAEVDAVRSFGKYTKGSGIDLMDNLTPEEISQMGRMVGKSEPRAMESITNALRYLTMPPPLRR